MLKLALSLLLATLAVVGAQAQVVTTPLTAATAGAYNASPPTCTDGKFCYLQTDSNGQLKVSASVSASVTGFAPGGAYASLTATGSSADAALPAGAVVVAWNTGTTSVSCKLGVGAQTAIASENIIPSGGSWFGFTVGSNTHIACINQAGDSASNVVVLSGGAGIPTGSGGGGGAASSNASVGSTGAAVPASATYIGIISAGNLTGWTGGVSVADGSDVALGAKADAAWSSGSGSAISLLKNIAGAVAAPIPAGSNTIGAVTSTTQAPVAPNTATATTSNLVGCQYNSSQVTFTDGQQGSVQCSANGKLVVLPYAPVGSLVSGVTAAMTGTTSTSLIGAPAGSLHNYVTQLICTNSHATVGTFVAVQDGSGGTTIYEGYAAAVGGGFSLTFPAPLRQPTAATALFVADVTTGANVICSASGYSAL